MKPIIPILLLCGVAVGAAPWPDGHYPNVVITKAKNIVLTDQEIKALKAGVKLEDMLSKSDPRHPQYKEPEFPPGVELVWPESGGGEIVVTGGTNDIKWLTNPASNFVASVSWRTNVVEGDNGIKDWPNVSEKWTITTISEVHTLTFDWFGRRAVEHVVPVSVKTNTWRLELKWEASHE